MADIKLTESEIKALDLLIALAQEEESGTSRSEADVVPLAFPAVLATVAAAAARATPAVARATPAVAEACPIVARTARAVGGPLLLSESDELSSSETEALRKIKEDLQQEITLEKLLEIRRNLQQNT
jgi:DNA-directed RNA polymerase beta' subunit